MLKKNQFIILCASNCLWQLSPASSWNSAESRPLVPHNKLLLQIDGDYQPGKAVHLEGKSSTTAALQPSISKHGKGPGRKSSQKIWSGAQKTFDCQHWQSSGKSCNQASFFGSCGSGQYGVHVVWAAYNLHIWSLRPAPWKGWMLSKQSFTVMSHDKWVLILLLLYLCDYYFRKIHEFTFPALCLFVIFLDKRFCY